VTLNVNRERPSTLRRLTNWLVGSLLSGWLPVAAAEFTPPLSTPDGFAVPQPGQRFEFPRDHGSHPDFKIEWWYVTGHLFGEADQRFGFQATFFRRAAPRSKDGEESSAGSDSFDHGELHLAHMALLDVRGGRFVHEERLNRRGWDAGAATNTLAVWNGNWSLRLGTNDTGSMMLHGSVRGTAAFALTLTPSKPLVVFGEKRVSRKAAEPTAAS
jgi:predicted secreted hydrolase